MSDLAGSSRGETQSRGTGEVGQGSKKKEADQEYQFSGSHTEVTLAYSHGTTSGVVPVRGKES